MNKFYTFIFIMLFLTSCIQPIQRSVKQINSYDFNYITGKLIGEGGRSIPEALPKLACTVKNRTQGQKRNWSPARVMEAYYASYVTPTQEEIEIVKKIVIDNASCGKEYFAYSLQDVVYLGIKQEPLYKFCQFPTKCLLFFSKDYKK